MSTIILTAQEGRQKKDHSEHQHKGRTKRQKAWKNLSHGGRWRRQWRELLIRSFGGKCVRCNVHYTQEDLEFAHIGKTPLSGTGGGRGSYQRMKDILDHPDAYALMCNDCHASFDEREGRE